MLELADDVRRFISYLMESEEWRERRRHRKKGRKGAKHIKKEYRRGKEERIKHLLILLVSRKILVE